MKITPKTPFTVGLLSLALLTVGSLSLSAQWPRNSGPAYSSLSGTYELERTRGGDPRGAAEAATRSLPSGQRDRAYQSLLGRLEAPETLSIERNGRTITIASSRGPRSAFDADGQSRRERGQGGSMVTTRADLSGNGNKVTVSTSGGSRGSDFTVTFESQNNGNNLLVTRRLDDDDLRRPVTLQSYYRRIETTPRWDVYSSGPGYGPGSGNRGDRFAMLVPEGTRLFATLDTPLSMRTSRNGEAFVMTVRGPAEFQGARIDGVISRVNSYRSGNGMDLRVDFQTIEWRGRSAGFDAFLNTVRLSDGTILRVDADGETQDSSRRETTIQNGAIGATVGAIIGALAGGGKGAAAGALIGGAGGVILSQGHEQLDLPRGADVTLTVVRHDRTP